MLLAHTYHTLYIASVQHTGKYSHNKPNRPVAMHALVQFTFNFSTQNEKIQTDTCSIQKKKTSAIYRNLPVLSDDIG